MTTKTRQVSTQRVEALTRNEEDRFRQTHERSRAMWSEALEFVPRGVPSSFQDSPPHPIFLKRGKGSRVWDVDDNEYVDFHNGFGVMVVGHAHPLIAKAIARQAYDGTHFAQPVADVKVVAEELARRFRQPQWRFTNSGTESTLDAVRLARGFTGRDRIVKIEASYHGHHDALFVSVEPPADRIGSREAPNSVPYCEGIPKAVTELTSVISYNDLDNLERLFQRYPDEVAAVIVEPVMLNIGVVLPEPGYLEGLRDLTHKHGALLIFDEVKTGATIAPGGATERFDVVPDLVCLAKAIGGGLPCGAIGGRSDVMHVIDEKRVAQFGTFNGNPLTMAASRVTLTEVLTPAAYAHFEALAETLHGGLQDIIYKAEMPWHVITLGPRGCVTYRAERVRDYRDYLSVDKPVAYLSFLYQCNRGLIMAPGAEENWTLSVQHSHEDVQRYVASFAEMVGDLTG